MIPTLIRSYELSAAVLAYRIVKFSDVAASSKVATATTDADPMVGTTGKLGGDTGDLADVTRAGLGGVQLGGTVGAGDPLTSDDEGKAIEATVAGQRIIGFAEQPGVENDVIDYFCAPSVLAVPEA